MGHIFVSYSRKDTTIVDRLISELEKAGHKVWIDREDIRGGEQWRREIVAAIDGANIFLLILSPNSVKSDNVRKELDLAEGVKKRILPVVIKPTTIPEELRYQLVGLQRLDLSHNFQVGLNQLLAVVADGDSRSAVIPKPTSGIRHDNRKVAVIATAVVLVILLAVVLIYLIPHGNETAPTPPAGITEVTTPSKKPSSDARAEADVEEATLEAAIATALAATKQAEASSVVLAESPSPAAGITPLLPAETPTRRPVDTPAPDTPPADTPTNTPTFEPTPTPTTDLPILIEDFEGFSSQLDDIFVINRNAGNEGKVSLVGLPHLSQGRQALAFEFDIRNSDPNHYIGFDRELPPQDWSSYSALCFWIESDGSNRSLVLQFGESKNKFWKQISSLATGTGDYCISLNDPHQINLRAIAYYGVYVEGPPLGQSVIYIDNIRLRK